METPRDSAWSRPDTKADVDLFKSPTGSTAPPQSSLGPAPVGRPDAGQVVGKYRLIAPLGRGSFSTIFRAEHCKLRAEVAVKVIDLGRFGEPERILRSLVSEAVLLAQINHPHVVRVWDLEDEGPWPYLVTEFVKGRDLGAMLKQVGPLPVGFAVALVRQAVEGLAVAHEAGIVHRDVKPSNLLVDQEGAVKLVDLGLAMARCERLRRLPELTASAEGVAEITGTAAYMAPEQARSAAKVDHRADMYSLGATLYQLLTGRLPFEAPSLLQMVNKHIREAPLPPSAVDDAIPKAVSDATMRLLAKNPDERYADYDELRMALGRAVGDRRRPRPLGASFLNFCPAG